jgi:FMN-dependent NADH-azoreductase
MKTLLQITSSLNADAGQSSASQNASSLPGARRTQRRVHQARPRSRPVRTHAERFQSFLAPGERTAAQQAVVDSSDALIDELRRADVIVIGLPMYNFGVPSTLKARTSITSRAPA